MSTGIKALRPKSEHNYVGQFLWRYVWGPISLLSAFLPLMFINVMQFFSLLILPFSHRIYYAYNRVAAFCVWGWWAWSIQRIVGAQFDITGDQIPEDEDAVVIANHQTMGDIPVIMCLALTKGRVADLKWMVKDVLKYVPGVGWGLLFLDCLFLKRRWAEDEAAIHSTFRKYLTRKAPLWLCCFPEGTRITPAKLAASQDYARRAGQKPTDLVMLPRPKGFAASVIGLKSHVTAVYDLTIYYPEKIPTLVQLIRGDADRIRIHVRRHLIKSLPSDEKGLGAWLTTQFYEKDDLLKGMHEHG